MRINNDYFLGAPDFAIEVLSRSNTMDEILERQDICFAGPADHHLGRVHEDTSALTAWKSSQWGRL